MSDLEEISIESREGGSGGERHAVVPRTQRPEPQENAETLRRRGGDLSFTVMMAGVLSIVVSAFIIYIKPQLHPNPNDESAALLRIAVLSMGNSAPIGDVPQVPHWAGPPRRIVVTYALLCVSLSATLISAFFAILARSLLDLPGPVGSQGSNFARSRRRRRFALDSCTVLSALSLLLQLALVLFTCALSVYFHGSGVGAVVAAVILVAFLYALPPLSVFAF